MTRARRTISIALALSLGTAGCTGRARIASGAATTVLGGLLIAGAHTDEHCTSPDGPGIGVEVCDATLGAASRGIGRTVQLGGVVLLVTGLVLLATGFSTPEAPEVAPPVLEREALQEPLPITLTPGFAQRPRLVQQLAMQIGASARLGHCVASVTTGRRLEQVDPAFYRLLLEVDELHAICVARVE